MPADSTPWHSLPPAEVLQRLDSTEDGLTEAAARDRLARFGPNALPSAPPRSAWLILLDQLRSVIVGLLIAAAAVAFLTGDEIDAIAIIAVLVINAALGFVTEFRARQAMQALLELDVMKAVVARDGELREVDARDLVPGDVVEIEAGQAAPADARFLSTTELTMNEAALTGESLTVSKDAGATAAADAPLAERPTMMYKATAAATGRARAVVVATGQQTELGRIGEMVRGVEETRTPLERRLDQLGHRLLWVTLIAVAAVVGVGLLRGEDLAGMVKLGITLAVAAVPEGLLAIATITMAVGVRRMARRRASIRRLPVVETLGAVTVVCTDKTGTLTTGEMTATTFWVAGREYAVTGAGYGADGEIIRDGVSGGGNAGDGTAPHDDPALATALRISVLANRADVVQSEDGRPVPRGDPTEAALIVAGRKAGLERETLLADWPEEAEIPFSSERQLMATIHRDRDGSLVAYVKGAPRRLLELSNRVLRPDAGAASGAKAANAAGEPLDEAGRERLREINDELAARGLRVLALAIGQVSDQTEESLRDLLFVGFVGIVDPPAPGVKDTIARFRDAGITTVMLTGDQRLTAVAIARELGVLDSEEQAADGRELEQLSDSDLTTRLAGIRAMSRVSPADKLRVVEAHRANGAIVAMLGDGVNDAPALKSADVGVAMGRRGTDVAKEAASVVLQDDRFATIGAAIEEGRVIFANIQKFVFYLFSCNLAEVMVLFAAGVVGLPIPLLPLQILWLNLVTDTFPALALAFEPAEPDVMRQPPHDPKGAITSRRMLRSIVAYAALITAVTLGGFMWGLASPERADRAVTIAFLTLSLAQLFHLGNARSAQAVVSLRAILRNRYALGAIVLTVGLQALAVQWSPLAGLLGTQPLPAREWLIAAALGLVPAVVGQTTRAIRSRPTRPAYRSASGPLDTP